ncbi:MAG: hypothetical protein ACK55I_39935, partial [bacterium]
MTIYLTITPQSNSTELRTSCGSYTWTKNGQTYTSSGTYTFNNGCGTDSLVLTITPQSNSTELRTECASYTWPKNGQT